MTIEELEFKHRIIIGESDLGIIDELSESINYGEEEKHTAIMASRLSIQFAIELLEELKQIATNREYNDVAYDNLFYLKIQELKTKLNERRTKIR